MLTEVHEMFETLIKLRTGKFRIEFGDGIQDYDDNNGEEEVY